MGVLTHCLVPQRATEFATVQQPCQTAALRILCLDVGTLCTKGAETVGEREAAIAGQIMSIILIIGDNSNAPAIPDGCAHIAFPSGKSGCILASGYLASGVAAGDVAHTARVGVSDKSSRCLTVTGDVAFHTHAYNIYYTRSIGVPDKSAAILDTSHSAAGINHKVGEGARGHRAEETGSRFVPVHGHAADGVALSVHIATEYLGVVADGSPCLAAQVQVGREAQVHFGLTTVHPFSHKTQGLSAANEDIAVGILFELAAYSANAQFLVELMGILCQALIGVAVCEVAFGSAVTVERTIGIHHLVALQRWLWVCT